MPMIEQHKQNMFRQGLAAFGIVIDLALTMAVPIVALTLLGKWLDQKYDHRFVFLLLGGVVGIGVAMRIVYTRANEMKRKIFGDSPSSGVHVKDKNEKFKASSSK